MKKHELSQSPFQKIPTPILLDVLCRLSTKSCLNCKLVCKDWYEIIINPEFAKFRSSHCSYHTILLYFISRPKIMLLDLKKSSKLLVDEKGTLNVSVDSMLSMKSDFTTPHNNLKLVNECNGLICLKSWKQKWSSYIICNLLTAQCVTVEQTQPSWSVETYGLGCCPVSHRFKLVRILISSKGSDKGVAEVLTLGTNEWRTVGEAPLFRVYLSRAFLHGSLHNYSIRDRCIWSFHFGKEQFLKLDIPDVGNRDFYSGVRVYDSCLCLSSLSEDRRQCEVWVMKDYGVKDSWVKLFVFGTQLFTHYWPLVQMDDEEVLVYNTYCYNSGLEVCDIKSGRCKKVLVPGFSYFKAIAYDARFSKLLI